MKTKIIAEIGINHNGDITLAKQLIDVAVSCGCDYVKFQKRNPDICVPENQKTIKKETPWGEMTYLDYKKRIEFSHDEYSIIDQYCKEKKIKWFSSVWDEDSVDFMKEYCNITKIPSALITNHNLCKKARLENSTLIISTGMSTESEIEDNVSICNPDIIMHTNSTYPSPVKEINLSYITWLMKKYNNRIIGYSGHELNIIPSLHAVALGAKYVERHITIDKNMWGSDQKASLNPSELNDLILGIRDIENSLGKGGPRTLLSSEKEKKKSLRG